MENQEESEEPNEEVGLGEDPVGRWWELMFLQKWEDRDGSILGGVLYNCEERGLVLPDLPCRERNSLVSRGKIMFAPPWWLFYYVVCIIFYYGPQ